MATSLEELEKRLTQVEQELADWRRFAAIDPVTRGAGLWKQAEIAQRLMHAGWSRTLEQMQLSGEPVGAEVVQQMMTNNGIQPEQNEFSRSLIEMREE